MDTSPPFRSFSRLPAPFIDIQKLVHSRPRSRPPPPFSNLFYSPYPLKSMKNPQDPPHWAFLHVSAGNDRHTVFGCGSEIRCAICGFAQQAKYFWRHPYACSHASCFAAFVPPPLPLSHHTTPMLAPPRPPSPAVLYTGQAYILFLISFVALHILEITHENFVVHAPYQIMQNRQEQMVNL